MGIASANSASSGSGGAGQGIGLAGELRSMACSQSQPRFMFLQALDILAHRKTEILNSWTLKELIADEIRRHKHDLTATLDEHLPAATRDFLDGLLDPPEANDEESRLQKSRLASSQVLDKNVRLLPRQPWMEMPE